jgi:hypothetical protein
MSTVTSVLVPLIGVVVGAVGVLLAQYLSTRVTKEQAEAARQAAIRAERKSTILALLEATQRVERAAEERYLTGKLPDDFPAYVHDMWFQNRCIMLVNTPELVEKCQGYVWCLHATIIESCQRTLMSISLSNSISIRSWPQHARNLVLMAMGHCTSKEERPLRPELAAPLAVCPSPQVARCAGGRARWRL